MLFVLFLVIPAVDLYLLLQLGRQVGFLPTLALLLAIAGLGVTLARAEGVRVLGSFQDALAAGKVPQEGVASGLLVLLGGVLLVVPGLLSDVLGVLLLLPFTRRLFVRLLISRVRRAIDRGTLRVQQVGSYGQPFSRPPGMHGTLRIIDTEGEALPPAEETRALPPPPTRVRR